MSARFLLSTLAFLICAASAANLNAQSIAGSALSSTTLGVDGNGWGKGGKPKPTPTPSPAPTPTAYVDPLWTGANSGSWADPNNWSPAGVPTATDDVTFSGTPANFPDQPAGTTILHSISFSADAASFTGLNTTGEIFALRDASTFTPFTQASSNLQTINQLDVYFTSTTASQIATINLSGTGGLTLSQGLRWGTTGASTQQLVIQGPGSLTVNGALRGDLTTTGATGGTARRIFLNGDATSGQIVTFNPTNSNSWTAIAGITLGGRVTLNIQNAAAIDAGDVVFASGANDSSLFITGVTSGSTFDRNIAFTAGSITGGTQTIGVSGVSAIYSGTIATAGTNNTVALSATPANTATFSGVISGSRPISVTGGGTVVLSNTNTYTGTTTVSGGGSLFVTGSTASGSAVTVNGSGTTLGGSGTIAGSVTINSGGTSNNNLSPGATGVGSVAKLNTGALTMNPSTNFNIDITGAGGTANAGVTYDQVSVTGTVSLGGTSLALGISGLTQSNIGQAFFILANDSTDAISGTFAQGATITSGSDVFTIDYVADSGTGALAGGNDIALILTAVPEPSTYVAGGLALLAVGWMLRKRFVRQRVTA